MNTRPVKTETIFKIGFALLSALLLFSVAMAWDASSRFEPNFRSHSQTMR